MEIIYMTSPNLENAKEISHSLLADGLIACANIHSVTSMYVWDSKLEESDEYVIIFKTHETLVDKVMQIAKNLNSYDNPAIFSLPVNKISEPFNEWLEQIVLK